MRIFFCTLHFQAQNIVSEEIPASCLCRSFFFSRGLTFLAKYKKKPFTDKPKSLNFIDTSTEEGKCDGTRFGLEWRYSRLSACAVPQRVKDWLTWRLKCSNDKLRKSRLQIWIPMFLSDQCVTSINDFGICSVAVELISFCMRVWFWNRFLSVTELHIPLTAAIVT